ncbi:unnamed protein product [Diatraea saccharalis]|uniref:Uncharacterized protein n=1 Tax=Diatraea saccharalis TaxID=40085 RepID=A0A9N9QW93_9NEOP|nr:unnamed protein product [Diatraea saccharalis]
MDSDAFESVKSRGDEWNFETEPPKTETKANQTGLEMQDIIISKDAKLGAMRNTIAVMENDVCEPYCIYAHIYTALEKIFGVLCQNDKYKLYLNLMTAGKDIRCIDIKGKILFKLKILEKFSQALIAPCSQQDVSSSSLDCACLRAEVIARFDYPPLATESKQPSLDNKRAQLAADIMANDEIKEILSKESFSEKNDDEIIDDVIDDYSIDSENLKRLKSLQESYDELMTCYERIKYEKDCLQIRCSKYEELEKEYENLKGQLREYHSLWNEKEHYRKRSLDIDSLKEQYLVLADETSNLETQLKAESEINLIKTNTIEDLRNENITLEKKLNDALIAFEKEKNTFQCKLKETECTVMCQEQQIKSLSSQIDRLLEQGHDKIFSADDPTNSLVLIEEIETLKEQINNLKDTLFYSEEEKQQVKNELRLINNHRIELEDWKNTFEKEIQKLIEENQALRQDVKEKSKAIENLRNIVDRRAQEIGLLVDELEKKDSEKKVVSKRYQDLRNMFEHSITETENEKLRALQSLNLVRRESQELLNKINEHNLIPKNGETSVEIKLKDSYKIENKEIPHQHPDNDTILLNEIQQLREVNTLAICSIDNLQQERNRYKTSLELTKKKSDIMENQLKEFESVKEEMESLKFAHDNVTKMKDELENDLEEKKAELETALKSIQLCKKESDELIKKLDNFKSLEEEFDKLNNTYKQLMTEKERLHYDLLEKSKESDKLNVAYERLMTEKEGIHYALLEKSKENENFLQTLKTQSEDLKEASEKLKSLENELCKLRIDNEILRKENNTLQKELNNKAKEINNLNNTLETNLKEHLYLTQKVQILEYNQKAANENIIALQNENAISQTTLNGIRQESIILIDKLKHLEALENEYETLRMHNESMQDELNRLSTTIETIKKENNNLYKENQDLQTVNKDIEQALIDARNQLLENPESPRLSSRDVLMELENLKEEKCRSQNKIKDLLIKLDESDNVISELREQLLARDDNTAILQNHINELEDEIRKLHENLVKVIEASECISTYNSKAAHNIQMELAKLQNKNFKLEEQLSATKLKTEESKQDKNKYLSQVKRLEDEREIIVTDIKQLEMSSVGDSILSPQKCSVEDVLSSLDRIRKSIHAKSSSLEQTIHKVQTSSQIVLTKADEAKIIVEKEKQKIIMEKEEAIREKINMENKLSELRKKLENQMYHDQEVIKDLEANIQNQQLIANNSISKLKTELQNLQFKYDNSLLEIIGLQEKLRNLSDECKKYIGDNDTLKKELICKTDNMTKLQNEINDLKNKNLKDISVQVDIPLQRNVSSQTETHLIEHYLSLSVLDSGKKSNKNDIKNNFDDIPSANILQTNRPMESSKVLNLLPNRKPHSLNEVQILTANVEPTFDFKRSSYLNYKMQQLSPGKLEQYSILDDQSDEENSKEKNDFHLVNINSNNSKTSHKIRKVNDQQKKSSSNIRLDLTNDGVKSEKITYGQPKFHKENTPSKRQNHSDLLITMNEPELKDLNNILQEINIPGSSTDHQQKININVSGQKSLKDSHSKNNKNFTPLEDDEYDDDDSVKPKLKINVPRVNNESPSTMMTSSDGEKISVGSDILDIYSSPRQSSLTNTKLVTETEMTIIKHESPSLPTLSTEEDQLGSFYSMGITSEQEDDNNQEDKIRNQLRNQIFGLTNRDKNLSDDDLELIRRNNRIANNQNNISHHDLPRVEAEVYLIKPKDNNINSDVGNTLKPRSFALDYILNTVRQEVEFGKTKIAKESPKSKSDEKLYAKYEHTDDLISLKQSQSKIIPLSRGMAKKSQSGYKLTETKSVEDRSIMAKVEDIKDYEDRIRFLTNSLEITENDYKKRLAAIKSQYDSNIKNIINEHNQGVKNIQGLHEETLKDIIKIHETEIENLRTMSLEANRRSEKLDKENRLLKTKLNENSTTIFDEEPVKIPSDLKKGRKSRYDSKTLTKTNIVSCNVKPKIKSCGPCTCSVDVNISDTIKNIFEQVDVKQRKMAEHTYMKYIANKILSGNVDALDAQELSFLHLKVCHTWKIKLSKEEALQKRINSLESELINRQRHAQQHKLDRKVEEEKRRLQEVREAVCRSSPADSRTASPDSTEGHMTHAPIFTPEEKNTKGFPPW